MEQHTPPEKKWIARIGDFAVDIVEDGTGFCIVHIGSYAELKEADYPIDRAEYNANRIVACVNALSGIPDPAKWVESMKAENERLKTTIEGIIEILHSASNLHEAILEITEFNRPNQDHHDTRH